MSGKSLSDYVPYVLCALILTLIILIYFLLQATRKDTSKGPPLPFLSMMSQAYYTATCQGGVEEAAKAAALFVRDKPKFSMYRLCAKLPSLPLQHPHTLRTLNPAAPQELIAAARCAAAAFVNSPVYMYILEAIPDKQQRLDGLAWLFAHNFLELTQMGATQCLLGLFPDGNPPSGEAPLPCFFTLKHPGIQDDLVDMLRAGLWKLPFVLGRAALTRLLHAVKELDKVYAEHFNKRYGKLNYFHLERMVVAPSCQGQGVGTACLQQTLDSIVAPTARPCVLTTQLKRNVRFYQKLGFKVLHEADLLGCHHWFMSYEPEPPVFFNLK
eukprot:g1472.t1